MPTFAGSFRSLLLTPRLAEVTFAKRGFRPLRRRGEALESIPRLLSADLSGHRRAQPVGGRAAVGGGGPELRGFACEA